MKVLFFVHPGTNSRDIFLDMIRGFERAGHEPVFWELAPHYQLTNRSAQTRQQAMIDLSGLLATFVERNGIGLSVGMWANGLMAVMNGMRDGHPASFFEMIGLRHVMWWLDAPQWAHEGISAQLYNSPLVHSAHVSHLINNGATGREMQRVLGFGNVLARGYGIDEEVFRPFPDERREFDVVFALGAGDGPPTPVMLEELGRDEPDCLRIREEIAGRLRPKLDTYTERFGGVAGVPALLDALVASQLAERDTPVLDRVERFASSGGEIGEASRALLSDAELYVDLSMRLRVIERWERAFTFAHLAKRFRCATMGSGDLSAWGVEAHPFGEVAYNDMARVYARAKLALNVMRWQDDQGLNLKPYEITASGTACLCAERVGLDELWTPGEEIASFKGPGACTALAGELLSDDARREELAHRGRARTLASYTWAQRAQSLVETVTGAPSLVAA